MDRSTGPATTGPVFWFIADQLGKFCRCPSSVDIIPASWISLKRAMAKLATANCGLTITVTTRSQTIWLLLNYVLLWRSKDIRQPMRFIKLSSLTSLQFRDLRIYRAMVQSTVFVASSVRRKVTEEPWQVRESLFYILDHELKYNFFKPI